MDDSLLHTLLSKTGKAIFVDWAEHCLDDGKTKDIIETIRSQEEHGYTKKSYQTRVSNIKRIIKAGRLSDALLFIAERDGLERTTKEKAINLLEKLSFDQSGIMDSPAVSLALAAPGGDRLSTTKTRLGQKRFKDALIKKWHGCSITGYKDPSLLIASHIKPWSKSSPKEKVDPNNGLLLLPNLDRLFDRGLISFSDSGQVLICSQLHDPEAFGIYTSSSLSLPLSPQCCEFMKLHRKTIFCREK